MQPWNAFPGMPDEQRKRGEIFCPFSRRMKTGKLTGKGEIVL
ncbi:hypothetical protein HMPREF1141_1307 [Clostridium sp. MSTE9]|nr:hypothetical protein HMPREF1141_1307 [Clostridium sp. MSTE9]